MAGWLKDLKIKLVSLVENGANQAADIVLAKSADTATTGNTQTVNLTLEPTMADETKLAEFEKALKSEQEKRAELEKSLAAEKTAREDNEKLVAKLQADRLRDGYIARAKTLNLPGASPDDFAGILEAAERGMDDAQKKSFGEMLSSWSTVIGKSNVFVEVGSAQSGATGSEQKLDALAKDLQSKDPKLTYQKAYARIVKEQPGLYRQYLTEKGGR